MNKKNIFKATISLYTNTNRLSQGHVIVHTARPEATRSIAIKPVASFISSTNKNSLVSYSKP